MAYIPQLAPGACVLDGSLQDVSNGALAVVEIVNSNDVTVQGFTINGGLDGVWCHHFSYCSVYTNTIRQAGNGVFFGDSRGIVDGNNISNNSGAGLGLIDGSVVVSGGNTISGNGAEGMRVNSGSNLTAEDTIENNTFGIRVIKNSVLRAYDMTITGNSSDGVSLEEASSASFEQDVSHTVITGNGGNGVAVNELSFAGFDSSINVSGNLTQPDVACYPQYSATRGAGSVGGTTNCVEPEHKKYSDKESEQRVPGSPLLGKSF